MTIEPTVGAGLSPGQLWAAAAQSELAFARQRVGAAAAGKAEAEQSLVALPSHSCSKFQRS